MPDDLASSFDAIATDTPRSIAIVDDGRAVSWEALAERARRVAWYLATEGRLQLGDRVVISLDCDAEFLEVLYAVLTLGCVPVTLSARLDADASHAVIDRSDAKVVVHRPERAKVVRAAAKRVPKPWRPLLLEIGDHYERLIDAAPPAREWCPERATPDGVLLLSVGAAEPGAVLVWNNAELLVALRASLDATLRGARVLPLVPLTHTRGLFTALRTLLAGGTVVLTELEPIDATKVWDVVARDDVEVLSIGSTAALQAVTKALSDRPERWQLPRLRAIVSSAPVGPAARHTLAEFLPAVALREPSDAPRRIDDRVRVIEPTTGHDIVPGSGAVGTVVVGGAVPLGYYEDRQLTASRFCSIGGVRYAITGERATVDNAGTIHLFTDSARISGDESRIPASQVEEKLRDHPSITECVVLGVPDMDRGGIGEKVVAMVQVRDGHYLDEAELVAWCRARLGRVKAPERFLIVARLTPEECAPGNREPARLRAIELLRPQP